MSDNNNICLLTDTDSEFAQWACSIELMTDWGAAVVSDS